jgi:hypothetical protein
VPSLLESVIGEGCENKISEPREMTLPPSHLFNGPDGFALGSHRGQAQIPRPERDSNVGLGLSIA